MIVCRVCGAEHPDSKVRCDGELPNGGTCGKDLTNHSPTGGGGRSVVGGEQ